MKALLPYLLLTLSTTLLHAKLHEIVPLTQERAFFGPSDSLLVSLLDDLLVDSSTIPGYFVSFWTKFIGTPAGGTQYPILEFQYTHNSQTMKQSYYWIEAGSNMVKLVFYHDYELSGPTDTEFMTFKVLVPTNAWIHLVINPSAVPLEIEFLVTQGVNDYFPTIEYIPEEPRAMSQDVTMSIGQSVDQSKFCNCLIRGAYYGDFVFSKALYGVTLAGLPRFIMDLPLNIDPVLQNNRSNYTANLGLDNGIDPMDSIILAGSDGNFFNGSTQTAAEINWEYERDFVNVLAIAFYFKLDSNTDQNTYPLFTFMNETKLTFKTQFHVMNNSFSCCVQSFCLSVSPSIQIYLDVWYHLSMSIMVSAQNSQGKSNARVGLFIDGTLITPSYLAFNNILRDELSFNEAVLGRHPNEGFLVGVISQFKLLWGSRISPLPNPLCNSLCSDNCKLTLGSSSFTNGWTGYSNNSYCLQCEGAYLADGRCYPSGCPSGYYQVNSLKRCFECSSGCNKCKGPYEIDCLECKEGYFLYEFDGISSCLQQSEFQNATEPKIESAFLDKYFLTVQISFTLAVYSQGGIDPSRPSKSNCDNLFPLSVLDKLGRGYSCGFTGSNQNKIVIQLGANSSITADENFTFLDNTINSVFWDIPLPSNMSFAVTFESQAYPFDLISSSLSLAQTETLISWPIIDPYSIIKTFNFSPTILQFQYSTVSQDIFYVLLKLDSSQFGGSYEMHSELSFGIDKNWSTAFSVTDEYEPLFYQGSPLVLIYRKWQKAKIKPIEWSFQNEFLDSPTNYIIQYSTSASILIRNFNDLKANDTLISTRLLDRTLSQHTISTQVTNLSSVVKYNATTTIISMDSPIEIIVNDIPDTHDISKILMLDVSLSHDPDSTKPTDPDLKFFWSCLYLNSTSCRDAYQDPLIKSPRSKSLFIPEDTMLPNLEYNFTLMVSKENKSSILQFKIKSTTNNQVPLSLRRAKINTPSNYLAPEQNYYFLGQLGNNDALNFAWTSLLQCQIQLNFPNYQLIKIRIPATASLDSYPLQLKAEESGSNRGSVTLQLMVNFPPQNGRFIVSPTSGTALETKFELLAVDWIDEDIPISYEFFITKEYYNNTLRTFLTDYERAIRKLTMLPSPIEGNLLSLTLRVSDVYNSSTQVNNSISVLAQPTAKVCEYLTKLLANQQNLDIFTFLQVSSITILELDNIQERRSLSILPCSSNGVISKSSSKYCLCNNDWYLRDCSMSLTDYTQEKLLRDQYAQIFARQVSRLSVREFPLVLNNALKSLVFLTKFVELLQTDTQIQITAQLFDLMASIKNFQTGVFDENLKDLLLIAANLLDQILLTCGQTINSSLDMFLDNLYVIRNTTRLILKDQIVGEDEIRLTLPNLKIYTEKVNSATLSGKTLILDSNSPIIQIKDFENSQYYDPVNMPQYELEYIYWDQGLLSCLNFTNENISSNIFISITNETNGTIETPVPLDILYPETKFEEDSYECQKNLGCSKQGKYVFQNQTYFVCACADIREFSTSSMIEQIIKISNLSKLDDVGALLKFKFYKSKVFYITSILTLLTIISMVWGYNMDQEALQNRKNQELVSRNLKIRHSPERHRFRKKKIIKWLWLLVTWESIKGTHILLSNYTIFDSKFSRTKRFAIFYCRTMMLMAISALFNQGIASESYTLKQKSMINTFQILCISIYAFIVSKLFKMASIRKRAQNRAKSSLLYGSSPPTSYRESLPEPRPNNLPVYLSYLANFLIVGPLLAFFYIVFVISANVDERASNRWAQSFIISWAIDLLSVQLLKAIVNAAVVIYTIYREKKTKTRLKWAYKIISPAVMHRIKRRTGTFRRVTY